MPTHRTNGPSMALGPPLAAFGGKPPPDPRVIIIGGRQATMLVAAGHAVPDRAPRPPCPRAGRPGRSLPRLPPQQRGRTLVRALAGHHHDNQPLDNGP